MKKYSRKFAGLSWYLICSPFAVIAVLIIRIVSPWVVVRIGPLVSTRVGHFAANTELYCLEKENGINTPTGRKVIDLFFLREPVCNAQLALMWSRKLRIHSRLLLMPIWKINRIASRLIRSNPITFEAGYTSNSDRDIHNLLNNSNPVLSFTDEEEDRGKELLRKLGIPPKADFVCLIVRDSAYLAHQFSDIDWSYHNYRDSDIADYTLAAEALANDNIYVVRMGVKVSSHMPTKNPKIIDYPFSGMRSDFLDIYLGANCLFCISQGTGFDAIPLIFRRPIVYVNFVPISHFNTFSKKTLGIFKHHISRASGEELTYSEIFRVGAGQCLSSSCFTEKDILLKDNSPEEILEVVHEMADRIKMNLWRENFPLSKEQKKFWSLFPINSVSNINMNKLHGEIISLVGQKYLERNSDLL